MVQSRDGRHWTAEPADSVALVPLSGADWDRRGTVTPVVHRASDGSWEMLYIDQGVNPRRQSLARATSLDGLHWLVDPGNPLLAAPEGTLMFFPEVALGESGRPIHIVLIEQASGVGRIVAWQ